MKSALIILITFLTVNCFGQCAVATMEYEEDFTFNQNMREGIDPKKKREDNDLISLLRVDSTKLKTESYFVTILLKNYQSKKGPSIIKLKLNNGDSLVLREQKIELSTIDYAFGLDENEIFYPIDQYSYDKVATTELMEIEI